MYSMYVCMYLPYTQSHIHACTYVHVCLRTYTPTHILQLHNQTTGLLDPQFSSLHSLLHLLVQLLNSPLKGVSQTMGLRTHSNSNSNSKQ